jgi:hypothetical protein
VAVAGALTACGTDVDLGGTSSADAGDGATPPVEIVQVCEPCAATASCPASTACALLSGTNAFCTTLCPLGSECDADETCAPVTTTEGGAVQAACVPRTGSCLTAKMPGDGAVLEHCGPLEGPSVTAACTSCDHRGGDCQPNGCYGGWWCDTVARRCRRPPATCP